jgi:thiol-disulfide isomerase/thioredoxin
MKNLAKIFLASVTILFLVNSCDIVEEPYLVPTGGNGPGPGEKVRKVLLEDFTGQKCPNCPEAAELAHNLKTIYGEQFVLLTVHAGFYSVPDATGNFTTDYRTTVGNDLNGYFPFLGYPSGMVNRSEYKGSVVLFKDDWEGAVAAQVDLPAAAEVVISHEYNTTSRKLTCTLESTFLESLSGTYNICVFVTESGIVSPQQTEQGVNQNYEHNHVLRASMNGTWGDPVGTDGTATANVKLTDNFEITLDNAWNAENCGIVAFIYNTESQEVVQAEEAEVVE